MNSDLQLQSDRKNGGVWYELHSEREDVCEKMLQNAHRFKTNETSAAANKNLDQLLTARLQLIDCALDRIINGSYGECVVCGRWIEDTKLRMDAALPWCAACERKT